ncbi:YbaB/EbfC family nucleoid-associated protein [Mycobacterium sp. KBS0706]|jgi:DNA-binding YbaB/EbfC family protein|uniref:YbaB/EbfC family nucleoid-associated protein n=1 Tax=Mycobacterium sp. KBS0706 TaxID=2578109 RepID=UPI00110FE1F9|nr:YbaB/EbfC family nucleoid-associated protein [Mycobacterium sp. KBS0706]TSD90426.1 YbaB/EbfC family nucleoid-associated protein [Mycobacterium sp. KBS0706]
MKNLGQMMKQAQEMQAKMAEMQSRLGEIEVPGQAGAGMIAVVLNGKGELRSLKIDPKLVDPSEVEVLEDLIVAAFNDAKGKVEAAVQEETSKLMGGLKLPPGMKLPF